MKSYWMLVVVMAAAAILIKENLCVPVIRELSKRGILFPTENWDDCFLDDASTLPGLCKSLEECPDILKKWDKENIYPKTCYFMNEKQFVCCPPTTSNDSFTNTEKSAHMIKVGSSEKPNNIFLEAITKKPTNIFLVNIIKGNTTVTTKRPSNIFLDNITKITTTSTTTKKPTNIFLDNTTKSSTTSTTTKRPTNIFLDNITKTSTTATSERPSNTFLHNTTSTITQRPSNIFLDNINTEKITTSTLKNPIFSIPDIFNTEKPSPLKRPSERECDLQNQNKFETGDIVNGTSLEANDFPYMTVLGWKLHSVDKIWYPCGGVLVSSRFVLTAAHCTEIGGESPSWVHLGDKDLTGSQKDAIKIKQFIMHPGYNVTAIHNDIALVELEQEVNNQVACLWTQHNLPNTKLIALGYGHTRFEGSAHQLYKAFLNVITNAQCQEYYELDDKLKTLNILDDHLCAGDVKNIHNSCQGDTGGPLLMTFDNSVYVVGISSFGLGCADLPPSIYTRVSSFIDWLEPIIWPEIDVRFN